jgi:hypothetical protein
VFYSQSTASSLSRKIGFWHQIPISLYSAWRSPFVCVYIAAAIVVAPFTARTNCACSVSIGSAKSVPAIPRRSRQKKSSQRRTMSKSPKRGKCSPYGRGREMNSRINQRNNASDEHVTSARLFLFPHQQLSANNASMCDAPSVHANRRSPPSGLQGILGILNRTATRK